MNLDLNIPAHVTRQVRWAFRPRTSLGARNRWHLYLDIAWYGVLAGITSTFLTIFALRLGASDLQIGILTALPALTAILFSIPWARLVEREKKPLTFLLLSGLLTRVGYLFVALMPFVLPTMRVEALLILYGLFSIPAAGGNLSFTTMFAQIVPPEQRASVISIRNVLLGITSMLATLLGGKFLEFFPLPLNYQLLFGLAFVASMASFYHLTRLRVPPPPEKTPDAVEPIRAERGYFALFRASSRFTRFALASFVFYWGVNLPLPLYSIYWVKNLGASDAWIGLIAMVGSATTIFAYPIFARLSTRYGTRLLLLAATFGLAGYPLFTALTTSVEPLLLISFYGGIFGPAMQLSFFNGLLEVSPAARRPSYIALYNTLINLAAFAAPLIGTALTGVMDIRLALVIGAVLRVAGGMLFWRLGV